uniref:HTH myb-type domain-containing protein n=1 Tax=Nothobranchius furzeri TaxID=105023 RepID=A0A8C6VVX3_NOTFU
MSTANEDETAFMCLQMFQRFVSKSLRRSSWTAEEDARFKALVEKMRIGNYIPYTQSQLLNRWMQVLDPRLKKGPWTKEEDQVFSGGETRNW